jgi:hypothetical protein
MTSEKTMKHRHPWFTALFRKPSSFTYSPPSSTQRAFVLALYSDPFIGEVRIKPFLNALLIRGVIDGYQVLDRALKPLGPHRSARFTHIWCQRNMSTAQFAFLRQHAHVPIIYDLDDLLTSAPSSILMVKKRTLKRIHWCLEHATAITVASEGLASALGEDVPSTSGRLLVLKNGCTNVHAPAPSHFRQQLIWTSGAFPFFLHEDPQFPDKLARFVNAIGFEAILIGRFDEAIQRTFVRCRYIAYLDFPSYRQFLRAHNGALAIAPLPSRLAPDEQRVFDAKSDIKLVDYLCSGIVPVCSSAVPYRTSELFLPRLSGSSGDEIIAALERCLKDQEGILQYIHEHIYASGLVLARQFMALSTALDPLFA